jgi:hypothetical protein
MVSERRAGERGREGGYTLAVRIRMTGRLGSRRSGSRRIRRRSGSRRISRRRSGRGRSWLFGGIYTMKLTRHQEITFVSER